MRERIIDACLLEIGSIKAEACSVPQRNELINATKQNPLEWNPVNCYSRSETQTEDS